MTSLKSISDVNGVKRRSFIAMAAFAGVVAVPVGARETKHDMHKHHAGHSKNAGLVDAAIDCSKNAMVCRNHCIDLLQSGDVTLSDCLSVVNDTIAMCDSLAQLASSESAHLPLMEKACLAVCKDCQKQCDKHKDHHRVCKDCMESCSELIGLLESRLG
ncbi:four-helix bundle copper-binding protein [Halioxenophilus aromaticivorans]|uniref:Four-helix bundle copper-binding protein n=1 Tax=Halioxenophilus aromaticivorans TaxID=1306992 RepID=A0AAV3U2U0_9ALTE